MIDFCLDEDVLRQPTLYGNRKNVLIEQIEIDMEPSITKFEDELCRLINKDRMDKKGMTSATVAAFIQETHNKVSIVERRLRVGHHLGLEIVKSMSTFHLGGNT